MTTPLTPGRLTIEDLVDLPDDGHRYELLDGSLLVSPTPEFGHALAADRLTDILKAVTPPHLKTLATGVGVEIRGNTTYCVPDIIVFRAAAQTASLGLRPADVLLVVEVLSPSNRRADLVLKRHEYAAAGIPDYWIVDRAASRLMVLRLQPGQREYALVAEVNAGTTYRTDRPFEIEFDPGAVC